MPPNGVSILQQACLFLPHSQCPTGWACFHTVTAFGTQLQEKHLDEPGGGGRCWHGQGATTHVCSHQAQLPELPPQGLVLYHQLLLGSKAELWQWWNPQDSWCLRTCWAGSCARSLLLCLGVFYLTTSSCAPKKKHHF